MLEELIVVCGMHRSGTSAMAGLLGRAGYALGPVNELNELHAIQILHDKALATLGRTWKSDRVMPFGWLHTLKDAGVLQEIAAALLVFFAKETHAVVKDPRISIMVPLWVEIARAMNLDPRFVIMQRNIPEIARSLSQREGEGNWSELAHFYHDNALWSARPYPIASVHFHALLRDWEGTLEYIEHQLGIKLPIPIDKIESNIDPEIPKNLAVSA